MKKYFNDFNKSYNLYRSLIKNISKDFIIFIRILCTNITNIQKIKIIIKKKKEKHNSY